MIWFIIQIFIINSSKINIYQFNLALSLNLLYNDTKSNIISNLISLLINYNIIYVQNQNNF